MDFRIEVYLYSLSNTDRYATKKKGNVSMKMVGKRILKAFIIGVILGLVFIIPAQAESNPVVPGLQDMWRKEKFINSQGKDVPNGAWGIDLSCTQTPRLGGTGKWTIGYDTSHGSVKKLTCGVLMKDYSNDYSYIYYKEYQGAISSFTSCTIVSGGEYLFSVSAEFSDGYRGYGEYVFTIADDSSHTSLDEKIAQIVSSCRASTQWQTALNLYDWLTTHVYYDLNLEYYGADMILRGYGVCDGYSKAYMMLCKKAGIPVGRATNINHAWNAIQLGGNWYYVDATWDDPSGAKTAKSGSEGHWYFCITQKILFFDHPTTEFEKDSNIGECTSLAMNYYIQTKEWMDWGTAFNSTEVTNRFPAVIQDTFNQGETIYAVPDKIYYRVSNNAGYYLSSTGLATAKAILYYALSNTDMYIANGGYVRTLVTESPLTVKLLGWNITETGTLRIPAKVTSITVNGFAKTGATTVIIPDKCTEIKSKAFYGSAVRTVQIPNSVTSIASDAFNNCNRIIFKTKNATAIQYASNHGIIVLDP